MMNCIECRKRYEEFRASDRWVKRLVEAHSPLLVSAIGWRHMCLETLAAHGKECHHTVFVCACGVDYGTFSALRQHQRRCTAHRAMEQQDKVPINV